MSRSWLFWTNPRPASTRFRGGTSGPFWTEWQVVKGMTALVSTAYMDEAARFHRLSFLSHGQVLASELRRTFEHWFPVWSSPSKQPRNWTPWCA